MGELSDAELTRAAQAGDVTALGVLLARHEAGMRGVAIAVLGYTAEADDAVQDAAVVALRRIGDVRDPAAVGAWLRMVVRNACRARLRSTRDIPVADGWDATAATLATPEQLLDDHALRDWVWQAIEQLTPPVRLVMMLRHFSLGVTSYEHIAQACGLPVGTVRSRLSQGRAKLAEALRATAASAHDDAGALAASSRLDALHTLAAAERGEFTRVLADRWAKDVVLTAGGVRAVGSDFLARGMDGDLAAGVRQRPVHVVASREVVVWEMDLLNPPDDPDHCPPGVAWLMSLDRGRVVDLRLHHAPRETAPRTPTPGQPTPRETGPAAPMAAVTASGSN
ncbi:sigma-70 family RNA polymerase sigma factor [Amycolatopsis rhabdoformis]|uniref:Sigma-70 family RNA polymerase sigma factor n=1 Tax=Amycolatopsis rhabdoformis TaxID=1448059 RepID=A0ABZ1I4Y1_9PSEU|nr:sigma-70 family RNA polymerase sigma factor [Amycolatopsis rhabdoformis]WSE29489.1 sigma-70 family RNA polymerase sigma factor [Amycolatopsis rhabdoformis]